MKVCKKCSSEYEEGLSECPNCGSGAVVTPEDLRNINLQQKKEQEIAARHRKRVRLVWIMSIIAVIAIAAVTAVLVNADYHRVVYVDGLPKPSKAQMSDAFEMGTAYLAQGDLDRAMAQLNKVDERSGKYRDAQRKLIEAQGIYRDREIALIEPYLANDDYAKALSMIEQIIVQTGNDSIAVNKKNEIIAAQSVYLTGIKRTALLKAGESSAVGDFTAAISTLNEALVKLPEDEELQAMVARAYRDYDLQVIDSLVKNGDLAKALEYTEGAVGQGAADSLMIAKKDEIVAIQAARNEEIRQAALAKSAASLEATDYPAAIAELKQALLQVPEDGDLTAALNDAETLYSNDFMIRTDILLAEGKYTEAKALLKTARDVFPTHGDLIFKSVEVNCAEAMAKAALQESEGDLPGAIETLRSLTRVGAGATTPAFREMLTRLEETYKANKISEAEQAAARRDYAQALSLVHEAINLPLYGEDLSALRDYYMGMQPVWLPEKDAAFVNNGVYSRETATDNLGNNHRSALTSNTTADITYKLDGEYKLLTGMASLFYNSKSNQNANFRVIIYGDERELYSLPAITAGVEPISFEVDISGVDKLKFVFAYGSNEQGFIGDLMLHK